MKKVVAILALSLAVFGGTQAMAKDLKFSGAVKQANFKELSKEAGAAISFKNTAPAEPLGITGFDVGVEISAVDIPSNDDWNKAFGKDAPSYLVLPKLRARKGLPLGIDIGAMYAYVPDTNIKLWGVEVSKAILEGSVATPALGVRATYTKLAGVDDLDLQTVGLDVSISKGFLMFTPYAGVGGVWIDSEAKGNLQTLSVLENSVRLESEEIFQPRVFAGLKFSPLPLISFTGEVEYQERPIYSLKAAIGF